MGIDILESQTTLDEAIDRAKAAADEVVTRAVDLFKAAVLDLIGEAHVVIETEVESFKAWVETLGVDVSADVVRRPK